MTAAPVDVLVTTIVDAARRAIERGDWTEGVELAQRVLDVVPGDPTASSLLRTARARAGVGAVDQGRRYLTVLFSDVVGSTALSERLDPEDYLAVLNAYRELVREVVAQHDGHVDQYQGDGVVAYFGFPIAGEDDAVRAVEAGLEIVGAVPGAGRAIGVDLAARVGVHVGRTVMTSSQLGARDRNTAVGFATNVAARIQSVAPPGGVVVSESVVDAIAAHFDLTPIGERELRGVSDDVAVFSVASPRARSTWGDERLAAPLVGREPELALIAQAWSTARDGGDAPRVVVVAGDPGMGKSRLARAAIDLASEDHAAVIEVNCGRDFRHVGTGAIRRAVEKALALGGAPTADEVRAALRARGKAIGLGDPSITLVEALMGVGGPGGPALAPDRLREGIISALAQWMRLEAEAAPFLLVVEDLQWADETTVDLLRAVTSRAVAPGLMAVLTTRTGEMPAGLTPLLEGAIELNALPDDAAVELVHAFAGDEPLDAALIDSIARRGEGVPLFTEHLVIAALTRAEPVDATLPATLEGLLQSRLDGSGSGRALAEVGAVVGRQFSPDLVERVLLELGDRAPLVPQEIPAAVRALTRAGLIEIESDGDLRFRHALVLDVAYEMQLRSERPARHQAVARAIVALHGADASPEALAQHFERAGDREAAAAASLRAAESAADLAEFERAFEHLRHVDAMLAQLDGIGAQRLELARCMQYAAVSAATYGYVGDAEPAYLRALELCDLIGDDSGEGLDVQLAAALGGVWSKEVVAGDLRAAGAITDRLERMIPSTPPDLAPEFRRFVRACRGFELLFSGRTTDAIACLQEASSMAAGPVAVRLGTPHDYVAALDALLAAAKVLAADDSGADEALRRALRRTADLPFPLGPFSEAVVEVYGAFVSRLRGNIDDATARAQRVAEIGEQHGFREHAMLGQILVLAARIMEPDPDACQALENVLGIWRMAGGGLAVPVLLAELADGFRRVGDLDRARSALDDAAEMMERTGQRGCESELHRIGALVAAAGPAPVDPTAELVRAGEIALHGGSVLLARRAIDDLSARPDAHAQPEVADIAARVRAAAPADGAPDFEGAVSAD